MTSKVYVEREFNTTPEKLFPYLVQPVLIAQWFGPKDFKAKEVYTDPRAGGEYRIRLIKTKGSGFSISGKYTEINTPERLSFTLHYEGLPSSPPDSEITFMLTSLPDNRTQLSLTQQFVIEPVGIDMSRRTQAWEYMLGILAQKAEVEV